MPSAGAVCPPLISPVRRHVPGVPNSHIDTTTLVELSTETPDCKIFFTSDGSKPSPFQRKIGGREVTFKYQGPFTLKPGKRVLKAVAVTRDRLRESDVMSKQFLVDDIGYNDKTQSSTDYYSNYDSDIDTDTTFKSATSGSSASTIKARRKKKGKSPTRSKSPLRSSLQRSPKEAWASSLQYGDTGAVDGRNSPAQAQVPEGPFNPTNYSGTQINVWGAPPGSWPGMNASNGAVTFGVPGVPNNPYPTQMGYLTESMIQGCNPENRHVTVGDLRSMMSKKPKAIEEPPEEPPKAIEYLPAKEPSPEAVSPGNGDFKGNIKHIYAHMLEYAKGNKDFRLPVAEPKLGKMLEAKFEDEGDGYRISVVMAKPGVPRGSIRKAPKVETKPKKPSPPPSNGNGKIKKKETPPPKSDPYFAMETENLPVEGTVKPYANFNAEADAEVLRGAFKGIGTDEDAITNILAYRSNPQRQEIRSSFKTMFGKDLIDELKSELSSHYLNACKGLVMAPAEFDAYQLRKAIKGLGTDEDVLIEILCTRSNAQIKMIKEVYKTNFNKDLEKDIIGDTSGHLKRLLVTMVQANRSDSTEVDRNKAKQDAKALLDAGEGKWGTDESRFNVILGSRSYPQLRATFEEYEKISKKKHYIYP